jgi:hypothetical protein
MLGGCRQDRAGSSTARKLNAYGYPETARLSGVSSRTGEQVAGKKAAPSL